MYLENINSPQDIKGFSAEQRKVLAQEMRDAMLKRASVHGGHFGPDFGIVDKIIAELIQARREKNTSTPYEKGLRGVFALWGSGIKRRLKGKG